MIVTFEEYGELGGRAITSKKDYDRLEPLVEEVIDAYIKTQIPYWRVRPLEEYEINLQIPIVRQIDFVDTHGGLDYFQGTNDMALRTKPPVDLVIPWMMAQKRQSSTICHYPQSLKQESTTS